ncbi:MAG: M15 family metallopeptidase [Patescibacteria group bacterium]
MENEDITLISDEKVISIPIKENREPLVDLRFFNGKIDIKGAESTLLRESAAHKLLQAMELLPNDFSIRIFECYRSLSVQRRIYEEFLEALKKKHADWEENVLIREASKFVAPPNIEPPHTTGAAVDLTLIRRNGQEIDMGTVLNADPEECGYRCFTSAVDISDEAKKNRNVLVSALSECGFVNYPTEWWHWSYGDRYWAFMNNLPFAIYGSI